MNCQLFACSRGQVLTLPEKALSLNWVDIAVTVSAVALVTIGTLAVMKIGVFGSSPYIAYGAFGGAALFIIGQMIYKFMAFRALVKAQNQNEGPQKKVEGVIDADRITAHTDTAYSHHMKASEKLKKQLAFALNQSPEIREDASEVKFKLDKSDLPEKRDEKVGIGHDQGLRKKDEDATCVEEFEINGKNARFIGVFDGHGDLGADARYAAEKYPEKLPSLLEGKPLSEESITRALVEASLAINDELLEKHKAALDEMNRDLGYWKTTSGTCALGAFEIEGKIYLLNIGDARALLVKKEAHYQLTEDQKPLDPRFKHGIEKMGLKVYEDGRVEKAGTATARDLGTFYLSSRPKITQIQRSNEADSLDEGILNYGEDDYLILACDGFWDVVSNEDAAQSIQAMRDEGLGANQMAAILTNTAKTHWEAMNEIQRVSGDNISVVVVKL